MTGGAQGLLLRRRARQIGKQLVAVLAVGAYAFAVTYGIGKVIDRVWASAHEDDELDRSGPRVHAETAYDHGVLGHGSPVPRSHRAEGQAPG